jgi:hypothetical protein
MEKPNDEYFTFRASHEEGEKWFKSDRIDKIARVNVHAKKSTTKESRELFALQVQANIIDWNLNELLKEPYSSRTVEFSGMTVELSHVDPNSELGKTVAKQFEGTCAGTTLNVFKRDDVTIAYPVPELVQFGCALRWVENTCMLLLAMTDLLDFSRHNIAFIERRETRVHWKDFTDLTTREGIIARCMKLVKSPRFEYLGYLFELDESDDTRIKIPLRVGTLPPDVDWIIIQHRLNNYTTKLVEDVLVVHNKIRIYSPEFYKNSTRCSLLEDLTSTMTYAMEVITEYVMGCGLFAAMGISANVPFNVCADVKTRWLTSKDPYMGLFDPLGGPENTMSITCEVCNMSCEEAESTSRHSDGEPIKAGACGRCRHVYYCSIACQRADFKNHRKLCKGLEEWKKYIMFLTENDKFVDVIRNATDSLDIVALPFDVEYTKLRYGGVTASLGVHLVGTMKLIYSKQARNVYDGLVRKNGTASTVSRKRHSGDVR